MDSLKCAELNYETCMEQCSKEGKAATECEDHCRQQQCECCLASTPAARAYCVGVFDCKTG